MGNAAVDLGFLAGDPPTYGRVRKGGAATATPSTFA